jgi:hypothetical protein
MTTQVNSDNTIKVDASLKAFVRGEITRILGRFEDKLTRVEVHLSDVNSRKSGPADKRCLVEVRPAGARPLGTSAVAARLDTAIGQALRKTQRSLASFFGRQSRASGHGAPAARRAPKAAPSAAPAKAVTARKSSAGKKAAVRRRPAEAAAAAPEGSGRSPKKKAIFQARRKAWPTR